MNVKVKCNRLNYDGKGSFVFKGNEYSVSNLLPTEQAMVEINRNNVKRIELLNESKARVKVNCNQYENCGACNLLHINYQNEAQLKQDFIGGMYHRHEVNNILYGVDRFNYRNKVIASFSVDKKGNVVSGMYEENSHKVVPLTNCLIQNKTANEIIATIMLLMKKHRVNPYNEHRRMGILRHVLIRTNTKGEALVTFVLNDSRFPQRKAFYNDLRMAHKNIKTVISNINSRKTSVVLGDEEIVAYGDGYIEDILLGKKFKISSKTFYQINHAQTEILYSKAIEMAHLNKYDRVLDAYCGIGTIALSVADMCKEVIGVEINKHSIRNAIDNAKYNNIKNAFFIADDCTNYMNHAANTKERFNCVFLDPARDGCSKEFLKSLIAMNVRKVVYISCNPITQREDITFLQQFGYRIKEIQPVDMFPGTSHVENIVLLEKV